MPPVRLPVALEPRHLAIEGGGKLQQVPKNGRIRSGWHGVSFRRKKRDALYDAAEDSRNW
jgi:hypothetical protein